MSRSIHKVAVLGSGVMGSGIAAHFANIGLDVLMLDIVPFDLKEEEKSNPAARNRIVNSSLKAAIKSKPAAFYDKGFSSRIQTGNFDDDFDKIKDADWIIEVILENLDIKKSLFERVDKVRKKGSLITSNTSSIPIHLMAEGRSEDFKAHFTGTHFFNPPRYMRLFEVIPTPDTSKEVVDFFMNYGDVFLGKQTVLCKDTPGFIANRIGIYAFSKIYNTTQRMGLTIEEVDGLTGSVLGRPKTGTFRLGDLVGIDTSVKVTGVIKDNCPDDEMADLFVTPDFVNQMVANKWLGDKTKQGFYKKTKGPDGKRLILALNLETLEYAPSQKPKIASLKGAKKAENVKTRIKFLYDGKDNGGEFTRETMSGLFAYSANRVPEISDNIYSVDDAMRTGYAWGFGPFEYWDIIGIEKGIETAEGYGLTVADWVKEMVAAGNTTFYKSENGIRKYYDLATKSYQALPGANEFIVLDAHREKTPVFKNAECTLHDIGDGVLCFEFRSKMNSLGEGVVTGLNKAIDIAEEGNWNGLVIGNNSDRFSVGANLMMIGMMAMQQEYDELNFAIKTFQDTMMRCRYSSIPVVASLQGLALGGGCEMTMHCDAAMVAAESYIGLVEVGVGLIPGGGGTKEFAVRASDDFKKDGVQIPSLIDRFVTIAQAKVATSAHEAFNLGLLNEKDRVVMNTQRNIAEAKKEVLRLAPSYTRPTERTDIMVLGRQGLGALYTAVASFKLGKYISEHDMLIAKKVASVMCGGDLTAPQMVSERYLLDIEREAFLSLCGEQKTLQRIQHMLTTNKPLRN
ncbi:MAG: 3-hydroxyacyl-CoA dehydrogenase [Saprospiraceae bacterium]|jgi:3-hydroxyacyl-CoA dehydrogenase